MAKLVQILAHTAALIVLAAPADAQQCLDMPAFLDGLAKKYAETPRASGLMSDGKLMVLTASDAGNWTALIVTPEGLACMAAAGEGFGLTEPEAPGTDG